MLSSPGRTICAEGVPGEAFYTAPTSVWRRVHYYPQGRAEDAGASQLDEEKKTQKEGGDVFYPAWDEAPRRGSRGDALPSCSTVTDEAGGTSCGASAADQAPASTASRGFRYPPGRSVSLERTLRRESVQQPAQGPMVSPGSYRVFAAKRVAASWWTSARRSPLRRAARHPIAARQGPGRHARFQHEDCQPAASVLGAVQVASDTQKQLALGQEGDRRHDEGRREVDG